MPLLCYTHLQESKPSSASARASRLARCDAVKKYKALKESTKKGPINIMLWLQASSSHRKHVRLYITLLFMPHIVPIIALFYPRERNSSSSTAVKQAVRSVDGSGGGRGGGGPPGAGSSRPPGSRDRSNISCSSV